MADFPIERDDEEPIATITISNPDRRNAVGEDDMEEFADILSDLDAEEDVRCLVLTGDGDAFCAGADLASALDTPTAESIDRGFHAGIRAILTSSTPIVAKVRGPAVGAGASIATACDFVYAAESARIGFTFANIGLTADSGATYLLPRIVGLRSAMELLATPELIDAEEATELDLFTDAVPEDELEATVQAKAAELANGPTRVIASVRRLLHRSNGNSLEEQLDLEAREQERMFNTADVMEGMTAFMEGRDPEFEGR